MPVLYVTEQGAMLQKRGQTLVVTKDGVPLAEVECHRLDAVLIFGIAQITTQAMELLLAEGIEAAFLTQDGRLKGQLTPAKARNILLRVAQFEKAREPEARLGFARAIVAGKLLNCLAGIRRFRANHRDAPVERMADELEAAIPRAQQADDIATLRGIEGYASKTYFDAFAAMCMGPLKFPGRARRPPTDPVNALLSLGYTLVANELQSLLDAAGFDPYLGFLHDVDYGRPSLALDLLEEFRYPVVDRLTLYMNNKGVLKPEDFEPAEKGGVRLKRAALRTYFTLYEDWLARPALDPPTGDRPAYREIYRRQAGRLAKAIGENAVYVPHRFMP